MQYIGSALNTYMYEDVLGSIGMMSMASVISMPLALVTLILGPKAAKKFGLEKTIRVGLLAGCVLYITLFAAHAVTDVNVYIHIVWSGLTMGLSTISIYMQWGLVGEAIDYNEYITGKRTEGSIYGTFNLSRRIGQTVGNSAAVLLLGMIGYDATLAVQSSATILGIKALCVLVPSLFVVGFWAAFKFVWNITPEVRAKMAAKKHGN